MLYVRNINKNIYAKNIKNFNKKIILKKKKIIFLFPFRI